MKNIIFVLFFIIITQNCSFCETFTTDNLKPFTINGKYYGLKDVRDNVIVKPEYKKLIRLGKESWITQNKSNNFGLIDCNGNEIIPPKYIHVERYFNKFVLFGNYNDFGLYDSTGKTVIPPEYNAIMPLFGRKFLTYKNYKYGIYSEKGEKLLDNVCDYIYMPNPKQLNISYNGDTYELESDSANLNIKIFQRELEANENKPCKDVPLYIKTGAGAGYSVVSVTDYTIKALSSISNAYEESIDELMFSQGIDTVSIFMQMSWIPKFPVVFAKNYWNNVKNPAKGPFYNVRSDLKERMK